MSVENCIIRAKEWLDKNEEMSKKISIGKVRQYAALMEAAGGDAMTPAQYAAKLTEVVTEDGKRTMLRNQIERRRDLIGNVRFQDKFQQTADLWRSKETAGSPESLKQSSNAFYQSIMGDSQRAGFGTNISVRALSRDMEASFHNTLRRALGDRYEILAASQMSDGMTRDIYQELSALDNKGQLGKSQNPDALEIAKGVKVWRDSIFQEKQATSSWLQRAQDYLLERNHDRAKVTGDGTQKSKDAWIAQAQKSFSKSFSFLSQEDQTKAFGDIWERIKDGTWGTPEDKNTPYNFYGVKGAGGDILRRMGKGRVFVADGWNAEWEYASKYGKNSLFDVIADTSRDSAVDIAKATKWGAKPENNFEIRFQQALKNLPDAEKPIFQGKKEDFIKAFKYTMASQNAPAQSLWGRGVQGSMSWITAAKTGFHIARALPDIQNAVTLIQDSYGGNLLSNSKDIAAAAADAFRPYSNFREAMGYLHLFSHSVVEDIHGSLGSQKPGLATTVAGAVSKISGAQRFVDSMKYAIAKVEATRLGSLADTEYTQLPDTVRRELSRINWGEHEWNLARQSRETTQFMGGETRDMLTPESIKQVSDVAAEDFLRKSGRFSGEGKPPQRMLDQARFDVSRQLGGLLNQHADMAAGVPSMSDRYFAYGDSKIDDFMGGLRRMFWQFKMAGIVNANVVRRTYLSGDGLRGGFSNLAQHMTGALFWGAVGEYAYQLAHNQAPEDPKNPGFVAKMLATSGGVGLFMDPIIQAMESGKSGTDKVAGFAEAGVGPVPSIFGLDLGVRVLAQGATEIYKDLNGGRAKYGDVGRAAIKLGEGLIPGQNLPYLHGVLKYYLINDMNEFLNTGYLHALEKNARQTPGLFGESQDFLTGKPSAGSQ